MITFENWRARMSADMRLRDYRPRTQSGYELATRLFLDWVLRRTLADGWSRQLVDGHQAEWRIGRSADDGTERQRPREPKGLARAS